MIDKALMTKKTEPMNSGSSKWYVKITAKKRIAGGIKIYLRLIILRFRKNIAGHMRYMSKKL
jgi:hypothetical protein